MLHFLLILTTIFAISTAKESTEQKLETIKTNLEKNEHFFSKQLPIAEDAAKKKYEELEEKIKKMGEECKMLDELMREQFDLPEQLKSSQTYNIHLNKGKNVCADFLKLDAHERFEKESQYNQLAQLKSSLDGIEGKIKSNLDEMEMLNNDSIKQLTAHYGEIGKAVLEIRNILMESFNLYKRDQDLKAPFQIKYFLELTKIGYEFSEDLIKYFSNGQPVDQIEALKGGKDEFVKKLTSEIHYNGNSGRSNIGDYASAYYLENKNVDECQKETFKKIEQNSVVPEILNAEKEIIINAEKETMDNALKLFYNFAYLIEIKTIKTRLHKEDEVFSNALPKAKAASKKRYEELAEKFKKFELECKTLDTLMRKEFNLPEFLTKLNPWKIFTEELNKGKSVCEDFLKIDAHKRFKDNKYGYDIHSFRSKLILLQDKIYENSQGMKILNKLKKNGIQKLTEHYDKIGKTVQEMEKLFKKFNSKNIVRKTGARFSLKIQCFALKLLILKEFNLPDKVMPNKLFEEHLEAIKAEHGFKTRKELTEIYVNKQCEAIASLKLKPTPEEAAENEKRIKEFKEFLEEIRKMVEEAKEKLDLKIEENVIQTYKSIDNTIEEIRDILTEGEKLHHHDDIKAPIQIKYFMKLIKAGQEYAEKLTTYFHSGQPEDQTKALNLKRKDDFLQKLISYINYDNGDSIKYVDCRNCINISKYEVDKKVQGYSVVPADILNAEKKTMEASLDLLGIKIKGEGIHVY